MPTNRTRLSRHRRLSPGRIRSLLEGPDALLIGGGYFTCGNAQIAHLDRAERRAIEAEMREDWLANRPNLLAVWRGRAPDLNAASKWYAIKRVEGPCWAEIHLDERYTASGTT